MTAATQLPGRIDNLTPKEVEGLKSTWTRLITLFQQKGTEWVAPAVKEEPKQEKKKSGWGFGGKKKTEETKDLFLGTTTNPEWLSLPLEKAIPLIPGRLLETTF